MELYNYGDELAYWYAIAIYGKFVAIKKIKFFYLKKSNHIFVMFLELKLLIIQNKSYYLAMAVVIIPQRVSQGYPLVPGFYPVAWQEYPARGSHPSSWV